MNQAEFGAPCCGFLMVVSASFRASALSLTFMMGVSIIMISRPIFCSVSLTARTSSGISEGRHQGVHAVLQVGLQDGLEFFRAVIAALDHHPLKRWYGCSPKASWIP